MIKTPMEPEIEQKFIEVIPYRNTGAQVMIFCLLFLPASLFIAYTSLLGIHVPLIELQEIVHLVVHGWSKYLLFFYDFLRGERNSTLYLLSQKIL